ncbi:MAG: host attachment protein [Rhodospirillaceae bacterium]|nr:host attachment protein [Rhodospirillaceae bacterium]
MASHTPKSRTRPARKRATLLPTSPNRPAQTVWLLTVDGAKAQIYVIAPVTFRPTALRDGVFKQSNRPSRAITSDKPGHRGHAGTGRRHSLSLRSDPHNQAETAFVKMVATHINAAAREKRFSRLIVAAPPKAIRDLRDTLNAATQKKIAAEITHEWTKLGVREIERRLKAAMGPEE